MELSLKEAIKIVNDYAGRQVKQYDEAEDLFIFSPNCNNKLNTRRTFMQ